MTLPIQNVTKEEQVEGPVVLNEADDPNVLSVTTVGKFTEKVDKGYEDQERERIAEEQKKNGKPDDESPPAPSAPPASDEPPKPDSEPPKTGDEPPKPGDEPTKTQEPPPPPPKPPIVKSDEDRRFGVITKARRLAEMERDKLAARLKEVEDENAKLKTQVPAPDKPLRDNFEDEDAYIEALALWAVEKKTKEQQAVEQHKTDDTAVKRDADELEVMLETTMDKGREKYTDFNKLVLDDPDTKISHVMVEAALMSDIAEDILYYLGSHPEEMERIFVLSPTKVVRELTKIETQLNKVSAPTGDVPPATPPGPPTPPTPPPNKIPQAPDPITPPIAPGTTAKRVEDMSPAEYRAYRESGKT